ncbi:MAG: hypothetical protein G01um101413_868 [Parcubacteria group bacterium Gr01-1014_13]|nr:MAG: hypothetical protein G01um101413_868 [Parcubacteria group bacterium Gr01-1014_13]
MGDFLSEFSRAQADFAKKHATAFIKSIPPEMKNNIDEGLFAFFSADVERNMVLTMKEYANWLACKLVRSKNFNKQALPVCDENLANVISNKHNIPIWLVMAYISQLARPGTKLPLIGKIKNDGQLVPNEAALKKYEESFDWT